jgi:error-prone DNA polymerase
MTEPAPLYAELAVATNFSFLRGASRPEELVMTATLLGHHAIGIADRNSLAGVVRAYDALDQLKHGVIPGEAQIDEGRRSMESPPVPMLPRPKLLVGARLVFKDQTPDILAYPIDRESYGRLCRLLSRGKLRAEKGDCTLSLDDLLEFQEGLLLAVIPPQRIGEATKTALHRLTEIVPDRVHLAASMLHHGDDKRRLKRLRAIARESRVKLLAINDVLYHAPERRALADVIACIREHKTLVSAGRLLEANAERHLKPPEEMARLFREAPEAIAETIRFADNIGFSLDQLKYNYPDEPVPEGKTPQQHLEDVTWEGAAALPWHPDKFVQPASGARADREARLRALLLTVRDIVGFPTRGKSSVRGAARRPIPRSASPSASPASIPTRSIFCSSDSSLRNAKSRPTSTSISSTSGAKRLSRTSTSVTAMSTPRSRRPSSPTGRAAPSAKSARSSA